MIFHCSCFCLITGIRLTAVFGRPGPGDLVSHPLSLCFSNKILSKDWFNFFCSIPCQLVGHLILSSWVIAKLHLLKTTAHSNDFAMKVGSIMAYTVFITALEGFPQIIVIRSRSNISVASFQGDFQCPKNSKHFSFARSRNRCQGYTIHETLRFHFLSDV